MTDMMRRIYGIVLRQFYLIRRSPPRLIAFAFWPTLQMMIWGYLNKFLTHDTEVIGFTLSTLLGATLLLNFFERSNVQTMWGFLEDVWARNIGNILISPLSTGEMLAGYIINGLMATIIGIVSACIFAYLMFDYAIFTIGIVIIPFMINLILSGWCIGVLLICLVLRYGASGEHFGWMMAFFLTPFLAIYYPVEVLPQFLQHFAWMLPPTYVFESLRQLIADGTFNSAYFYRAFGLNGLYLVIAFFVFHRELNKARMRGGLLSMSE